MSASTVKMAVVVGCCALRLGSGSSWNIFQYCCRRIQKMLLWKTRCDVS